MNKKFVVILAALFATIFTLSAAAEPRIKEKSVSPLKFENIHIREQMTVELAKLLADGYEKHYPGTRVKHALHPDGGVSFKFTAVAGK